MAIERDGSKNGNHSSRPASPAGRTVDQSTPAERNINRRARVFNIACLIFFAGLLFLAFFNRNRPVTTEDSSTLLTPGDKGTLPNLATVSELNATPDQFLGQTVTVSGAVERILGPRSFTIGGKEYMGGHELLIVSAQPLPVVLNRRAVAPVARGDIIQVTGTVRNFALADFEKEAGIDLRDDLFSDFTARPALIARDVSLTPRWEDRKEGVLNQGIAATTVLPITDVLIIVTRPTKLSLIGRHVQLTSVPVQSMVGDKTFWIGPSAARRLFVALDQKLEEPPPAPPIEGEVNVDKGQTVTLSGVLRKLPAMSEARKKWGLSDAEAAALENEEIYLHAEHARVKSTSG